ncbi:MAG: hypothetical protein HY824_12660 [Acidobacteria bacterium]|nr:hypothetical protein [Acidobacteriota bacterium]
MLRAVLSSAARFLIITGLTWWGLSHAWPVTPVDIHIRWRPDVTDARRVELERRFELTTVTHREGTTWQYRLGRWTPEALRDIVTNPEVDDTYAVDRQRFQPEFPPGQSQRVLACSVAIGILILGLPVAFRRTARWRALWWSDFLTLDSPNRSRAAPGSSTRRVTAAVLLAAALIALAMTSLAGASFWSSVRALAVLYVGGYVAGSLLLARPESAAAGVIRTVAGLMLTSLGFLLSLVGSLPWFAVPVVLVLATVAVRGRAAFAWPANNSVEWRWDGLLAGLLALIVLSPIVVTLFYMAPGPFPPVFYNVDTPYSLEKVHALVTANGFPPPSLGNLGVRRTYHFGTHAMAALVSRGSGLLPHHALFLIVLPLLAAGVVAAAAALARHIAPALPRSLTVPLLLVSVPSLSRPFWQGFGPQLWTAATSNRLAMGGVLDDVGLADVLSNVPQNVGGDFLILGSLAGMAAAPLWGWTLPIFLIGASVIFKTTVGIALVSGFALSEAWRALTAKRAPPSPQLVCVGVLFLATYAAFFLRSFESAFRVQLYPLELIRNIVDAGGLGWLAADVLWLFLPVLVVATARLTDPEARSAPMLIMAIGPLLVMNATRLAHVVQGGGGAGLDWVQISHAVPFLVHGFALSLASRRWTRLGRSRRLGFLLALALALAPIVTVAGRYTSRLIGNPARGYEFVDNRPLAEALAAIPIDGSIIVTNDLRYPADRFGREDRQFQIPALFGHQAFAVNYAYEPVEYRRSLQTLLQSARWSPAILDAAREHHWTHLVIRKDYVHPAPVPLPLMFENAAYAVYSFP